MLLGLRSLGRQDMLANRKASWVWVGHDVAILLYMHSPSLTRQKVVKEFHAGWHVEAVVWKALIDRNGEGHLVLLDRRALISPTFHATNDAD